MGLSSKWTRKTDLQSVNQISSICSPAIFHSAGESTQMQNIVPIYQSEWIQIKTVRFRSAECVVNAGSKSAGISYREVL